MRILQSGDTPFSFSSIMLAQNDSAIDVNCVSLMRDCSIPKTEANSRESSRIAIMHGSVESNAAQEACKAKLSISRQNKLFASHKIVRRCVADACAIFPLSRPNSFKELGKVLANKAWHVSRDDGITQLRKFRRRENGGTRIET
jgi:hypothetical protein